jgi:hypothetical protein
MYLYTRIVQMKPAPELLSEGVAATTTVPTSDEAGTYQLIDLLHTELPGLLLEPLNHCSFDVSSSLNLRPFRTSLKGMNT